MNGWVPSSIGPQSNNTILFVSSAFIKRILREITHKSVSQNELWKNDYMSSLALVLHTGLEGDGELQFLMNGGDLLKVRSGSWKKTRYYKLQEDCKTMWHESRKTLKSKQTCETCAQGCVSQPFLCSCACVLHWPILCFVCQYECWWMSLTEVTTALPSSNPHF